MADEFCVKVVNSALLHAGPAGPAKDVVSKQQVESHPSSDQAAAKSDLLGERGHAGAAHTNPAEPSPTMFGQLKGPGWSDSNLPKLTEGIPSRLHEWLPAWESLRDGPWALPQFCCLFGGTETSTAQEVLPSLYTAVLEREEGLVVGLTLDTATHRCIVAAVEARGLAATWNSKSRPSKVIGRGDWLIGVNGNKGSAEELFRMLADDGNPSPLTLTLKRAQVLRIDLTRKSPGQPLGLIVGPKHNMLGVLVEEVHDEGVILDWNSCSPIKIRPGDRILSVNGLTNKEHIVSVLKDSIELDLEVITWL